MLMSALFSHTRKDAPAHEQARNASLLIRAGFIHKEMAGVYSYLPLGFRVLKKIEAIIREEMDAIGGEEMLMTTLQDPELWKKSGRWVEEGADGQGLPWFKTKLSGGGELGIANTHEEALSNLLTQHLSSYRDLPIYAYQFQNKFRNELRAKSGILRGREFLMKDLYSYNATEEEFRDFYEKCAAAYLTIFKRAGLGGVTYRTFASGGAFSEFSDEFQTLTDAGEDTIYIDKKRNIAVNKEVYTDAVLLKLGLKKEELEEARAIEVGNIFPLGTRFAEALGLSYTGEDGAKRFPVMGSYGIGLGRLMGAVVEVSADEKGLIWPPELAPFPVHIVRVGDASPVKKEADLVYTELSHRGIPALYDDREDVSAGVKFADAELIGIPVILVISEKTLSEGRFEVRDRASGAVSFLAREELFEKLAS